MFFEAPQVRITLWSGPEGRYSGPFAGGTPDLLLVILTPPARSKIGSRGPFKASKNRFVHCECGGAATTEVRGEHTEETIEQHRGDDRTT